MQRPAALSIALSLAALAVYVPRVSRTVAVIGDSAELVTAAVTFGVPHPPGYPLYTAVGHLITLGASNPAFFLNLSSAAAHAAAVGLVAYAVGMITDSAAAAVAGAIGLALSRSFLLGSLYAELFPPNDAFFALLLVLGIRIGRTATARDVCAFVFLAGLAAAHHLMFGLAMPALLVLTWPALRNKAPPMLVASLPVLFALPFAAAAAIVAVAASRDPRLNWGDVSDVRSLVHLVTRQDYGGLFRASRYPATGQMLERLDVFFGAISASLRFTGIALAAAGAIWLWRRSRREAAALLLAFVVAGPVFAGMNAIDVRSEARVAFFERFTTMCLVPAGVLIGCGVAAVEARVRAWRAHVPGGAIVAVASALPLLSSLRIDLSRDASGLAYARDLVASAPDGSLVLLTGDLPAHAAMYECAVERACGARIFIAPLRFHLPWYLAQVRRRHPDLSLPDGGDGTVDLTRMMRDAITRRPVLAHPELLQKRPELTTQFVWAPGPLLVRAYER